MSKPEVFHLGLCRADLGGATVALVPGAPERSEHIAGRMEGSVLLAKQREFTSCLGRVSGKPVLVCSTGIGGPSVSIAVEELAQLGIRTFLRVGTTGAIQPHIQVGDVIITTGAVRLDGASRHFAPITYPAVADFACVSALAQAAKDTHTPHHMGITAASDTFYPGQERYDTYSGKMLRSLRGSMQEWQDLNVLNFEMESATLFTMCSVMGLKAGMVAGVLVNRTLQEIPDETYAQKAEDAAISVALAAAAALA